MNKYGQNGVYFDAKNQKYRATISIAGEAFKTKFYSSPTDAIDARVQILSSIKAAQNQPLAYVKFRFPSLSEAQALTYIASALLTFHRDKKQGLTFLSFLRSSIVHDVCLPLSAAQVSEVFLRVSESAVLSDFVFRLLSFAQIKKKYRLRYEAIIAQINAVSTAVLPF